MRVVWKLQVIKIWNESRRCGNERGKNWGLIKRFTWKNGTAWPTSIRESCFTRSVNARSFYVSAVAFYGFPSIITSICAVIWIIVNPISLSVLTAELKHMLYPLRLIPISVKYTSASLLISRIHLVINIKRDIFFFLKIIYWICLLIL